MKGKKILIAATVIFSVVIFFATFLLIWFCGDKYPDFSTFRAEVEIPGFKEGAAPQGLAIYRFNTLQYTIEDQEVTTGEGDDKTTTIQKVEKMTYLPTSEDYYFISAYFDNGNASRIYVVGKTSGYVGYVSLSYEGKPFMGHVGGVATNGYTLWVSSDGEDGKGYVFCAKASSKDYGNSAASIHTVGNGNVAAEIIQKAHTNGSIEFSSKFSANGNASFLYYHHADGVTQVSSSDKLYVGEFYRPKKYETDKTHHVKMPDGVTENHAFMYEYNVSTSTTSAYDSFKYGLSTSSTNVKEPFPKIQRIFSIPDQVQGAAITNNTASGNGMIVFSTSYGLPNSELLVYDFPTVIKTGNYKSISFTYDDVIRSGAAGGNYYENLNLYYVYGNEKSTDTLTDAEGKTTTIYPSYIKTYSVPCMSEGLAIGSDGRINVLFESASKKYRTFVRQQTKEVYSFAPSRNV